MFRRVCSVIAGLGSALPPPPRWPSTDAHLVFHVKVQASSMSMQVFYGAGSYANSLLRSLAIWTFSSFGSNISSEQLQFLFPSLTTLTHCAGTVGFDFQFWRETYCCFYCLADLKKKKKKRSAEPSSWCHSAANPSRSPQDMLSFFFCCFALFTSYGRVLNHQRCLCCGL